MCRESENLIITTSIQALIIIDNKNRKQNVGLVKIFNDKPDYIDFASSKIDPW